MTASIATGVPAVQFAQGSNGWVAYQVTGEGPVDLVLLTGPLSNLDLMWQEPSCAFFLRNLASFSRLILFDATGTGLSDSVPDGSLRPEQILDDFTAVLGACSTERVALLGASAGGPMATLIAANAATKVEAVVLYGSYAKLVPTPDYPFGSSMGMPAEEVALRSGLNSHSILNPTVRDDPRVSEWSERFFRSAASPRVIGDLVALMRDMDVRPLLKRVMAPTLVLARDEDAFISPENSRYLAAHIPDAEYVELRGVDHHAWFGDARAVLDETERFLVGRGPDRDRAGSRRRLGVRLTRREEQVMALVSADLSTADIARRLSIGTRTVETHVANAYEKLGINSRAQLHRLTQLTRPSRTPESPTT